MAAPREYWIGSVFVVEWDLVDLAGEPVTTASVSGTVALPNGGTAPMVVEHESGSGTYRLAHKATAAGRHGWRAAPSGGGDGAIGGEFTVTADRTGAPPIVTDPATDVGMIRLLITDLDEAFPLFTDVQVGAFLTAEGNNVKRAAALACETIAVSEALVSKKLTTGDGLQTDGPAVAKELRERAAALRAQAQQADDAAAETAAGLDIVPLFSFPPPVSWGDTYLL